MLQTQSYDLAVALRAIVGRRHVLTSPSKTAPFSKGYRMGGGVVAAVVRPASIIEQWRVFQACIAADHVVIVQAANTGLTGGSTPAGQYDRPVVIINTMRVSGIFPILDATQVICLGGATLFDLERELAPLGREPHSVIGSSCIGASVVGGVCNNSGGALVQRGPAYTEYALYAQVAADGSVVLHNHLGIEMTGAPEEVLTVLSERRFSDADITHHEHKASSAERYSAVVRSIDEPSPARFNADPSCLFEASGSAGKLMVLAVRLDTFPKASKSAVFYIGTNDPAELTKIRRLMLADSPVLPVSGEYIHREAFDIASHYGKDTVLAIRTLGTNRLPTLFRLKAWVDRLGQILPIFPRHLSDKILQNASRIMPNHLPVRIREFRNRFEHHLILKVADEAVDFTRAYLADVFPSATGDTFECTDGEAESAMLHRFAVAGAAVRYRSVHEDKVEDVVALDIALCRNDLDWFERLPNEINQYILARLYYGHFFCHVFHQDYVVRKGTDLKALERALHDLLDRRGAEYPAEHNFGHLYAAKPALAEHYRRLDPRNVLNPGIGHLSRAKHWGHKQ